MQKQTTAKIPYDEVWIVTDNDEENAYKLDTHSLNRIKKGTPQYIGEKMTAFQKVKLSVRQGEEDERMQYFLCRGDYEAFLKTHILETPDLRFLDEVVTSTTKKNDFYQLYEGANSTFFYNTEGAFITTNNHGEAQFEAQYFDKNWQNYIQTAYSCMSFEQWILLHFEQGIAFYNSRNIIRYFDDKHYFEGHFQKGWYLYEKLDDFPVKKAFFRNVYQAIKNNLCLNSAMQTDIKNGKKFYEVNPYSDVFRLTALLLNNQNTTLGFVDEPVSYRDFNDISVSHQGRIVSISFVFDRKKPVLKREIEALFSVVDANDTSVLTYKTVANEEPIRKGDTVSVVLTIKDEVASPFFLYFKEQNKGVEYVLVWVL